MVARMLMFICVLFSPFCTKPVNRNNNCTSLVHIGDSTSVPIKKALLKNYTKLGFANVYVSAGNGRSISYSTLPDKYSGIDAVNYWKKRLGRGVCWVIALGTNDASSNAKPSDRERINSIMRVIKDDHVVWVNVWMDSKARPNYSVAAAERWNLLLIQELRQYPHAKIFDWASTVKANPGLLSDGIHYTVTGSKIRSLSIPNFAKSVLVE